MVRRYGPRLQGSLLIQVTSARNADEARLLLVSLCVVLGVFVTAASTLMFDRGARRFDVVETQLRLLKSGPAVFDDRRVYLPTNQNRLLVPLAIASLVTTGIEPLVAYTVVRALSAVAMFAGVAWLMMRSTGADPRAIAASLMVLALALLPSFNYGWEQPSDFPDVLFMTSFAALAVAGRRWLLLGVAVIAAANRESAAFAGVLWTAVHWRKANGRLDLGEIGFGAFVTVAAMTVVLGLRYALGGTAAVGPDTQTIVSLWETIVSLAEAVNQPSLTRWPVLAAQMFGPVIFWLLLNRARFDQRQKALIVAAVIISVLTLSTGLASELRRHLPALAILLYAAVAAEGGWRTVAPRQVTA
jgi:hypothetical protein